MRTNNLPRQPHDDTLDDELSDLLGMLDEAYRTASIELLFEARVLLRSILGEPQTSR